MEGSGRGRFGTIIALLVLFIALGVAFYYLGMPRVESYQQQKEWQGIDLLEKYKENPDMVGWLQVEGTKINYPVMNGEQYLYRNFKGESDSSGSLFVEEGWKVTSPVSLIYGHNMWMNGTMFNPLHKFEKEEFFNKHKTIKFYVITGEGSSAEKRTYEITQAIRTDVGKWSYSGCQFIETQEELDEFMKECDTRSFFHRDYSYTENAIVLSTCSYHIKGRDGRLLIVGKLVDRQEQTRIDPVKK